MTAEPMASGPVESGPVGPPGATGASPDRERVLTQVIGMLAEVTGEDQRWAARVTAASRLEADLRLESVELAALGELLGHAYGQQVDLTAFIAELEIYEIIALTVGDLVAWVCASAAAGVAGSPAARPAASPAGMPR
jgi:acyl carrier protein